MMAVPFLTREKAMAKGKATAKTVERARVDPRPVHRLGRLLSLVLLLTSVGRGEE